MGKPLQNITSEAASKKSSRVSQLRLIDDDFRQQKTEKNKIKRPGTSFLRLTVQITVKVTGKTLFLCMATNSARASKNTAETAVGAAPFAYQAKPSAQQQHHRIFVTSFRWNLSIGSPHFGEVHPQPISPTSDKTFLNQKIKFCQGL